MFTGSKKWERPHKASVAASSGGYTHKQIYDFYLTNIENEGASIGSFLHLMEALTPSQTNSPENAKRTNQQK